MTEIVGDDELSFTKGAPESVGVQAIGNNSSTLMHLCPPKPTFSERGVSISPEIRKAIETYDQSVLGVDVNIEDLRTRVTLRLR